MTSSSAAPNFGAEGRSVVDIDWDREGISCENLTQNYVGSSISRAGPYQPPGLWPGFNGVMNCLLIRIAWSLLPRTYFSTCCRRCIWFSMKSDGKLQSCSTARQYPYDD